LDLEPRRCGLRRKQEEREGQILHVLDSKLRHLYGIRTEGKKIITYLEHGINLVPWRPRRECWNATGMGVLRHGFKLLGCDIDGQVHMMIFIYIMA
jgi:hypothetical protein